MPIYRLSIIFFDIIAHPYPLQTFGPTGAHRLDNFFANSKTCFLVFLNFYVLTFKFVLVQVITLQLIEELRLEQVLKFFDRRQLIGSRMPEHILYKGMHSDLSLLQNSVNR